MTHYIIVNSSYSYYLNCTHPCSFRFALVFNLLKPFTGGYGKVTPMDIKDSNTFLDELSALRPAFKFDAAAGIFIFYIINVLFPLLMSFWLRRLDCGAGIGRVTKLLLLKRFSHVDMVEQSPRLLNAAPAYIGRDSARASPVLVGLQAS